MSKTRLSPLRRAYLVGYRHGLSRALARMASRAQAWEDEISQLQGDFEGLLREMRSARDEQAIKQALVERLTHPGAWLN